VLELLRDIAGSQAEKLGEIPGFMDELVLLSESAAQSGSGERRIVEKIITIEAPEARLNDLLRELRRAEGIGCMPALVAGFLPLLVTCLV
jgi:hypothetical protein